MQMHTDTDIQRHRYRHTHGHTQKQTHTWTQTRTHRYRLRHRQTHTVLVVRAGPWTGRQGEPKALRELSGSEQPHSLRRGSALRADSAGPLRHRPLLLPQPVYPWGCGLPPTPRHPQDSPKHSFAWGCRLTPPPSDLGLSVLRKNRDSGWLPGSRHKARGTQRACWLPTSDWAP